MDDSCEMIRALREKQNRSQRRRDDNKNKICGFEGGGENWGQRGRSSKTLFSVGNATTIKF